MPKKPSTAALVPLSRQEVLEKLKLPALMEELSANDYKRATQLTDLLEGPRFIIPRSACLETLYPAKDREDADSTLRAFTSTFNKKAKALGLCLSASKNDEGQPILQFLGPDNASERAAQFTRSSDRPLFAEKNLALPGDPSPPLGSPRQPVTFCVLDAREDAPSTIELLDQLKVHFSISSRFLYDAWDQRQILTGETIGKEYAKAIGKSDFVFVLFSPRFLASPIWERARPHLTGTDKPLILVDTQGVSDQHVHIPPELLGRQRFRLEGKPWSECTSVKAREAFALKLFQEIEQRLERWSSGQIENPRLHDKAMRAIAPREVENPEKSLAACADLRFDYLGKPRESQPQSALEMLQTWVCDEKSPPYAAVLGEFGIGKTTTLKQLAHALLDQRADGKEVPLPIYLDLRTHISSIEDNKAQSKVPELEPFLDELLRRGWKSTETTPLTGTQFLRLVREQGALAILDGLDEKLVHLNEAQGKAFIRLLWSILPPKVKSDPIAAPKVNRGKLILSCRSHYFPTLQEQNRAFTGDERDELASSYYALIILPFSEEQVRGYLSKRVGEGQVEAVLRLIASIHNLSDLAIRPFFLKLIHAQIDRLEAMQMRGEKVRGVTLYDHLVQDCLLRDGGKHQLLPEDKKRLMEDIAAALWQSGSREWPWERVFTWLRQRIYRDPELAASYPAATKPFEQLSEDFRTATLVLRPDNSPNAFRFAHTSLQEYFLACHLHRALAEGRPEAWAVPMTSLETLDFIGQLIEVRGTSVLPVLTELIAHHRPQASLVAFRYWHRARETGMPVPPLSGVDLPGENLERLHLCGAPGQLLDFRKANLRGANLAHGRLAHLNLSGADLSEVNALRTEFEQVDLSHANLERGDFTGSPWRDVNLERAKVSEAQWWNADWIRVSGTESLSLPPHFNLEAQISPPPPKTSPSLRWPGHSASVLSCAWSPDGQRLLSASDDNTLKVWDARNGAELLTLQGHSAFVMSCAWSPDGQRLLSASADKTLKVWDARNGAVLLTLQGHSDYVWSCAWSPDGQRLLSASDDNTLKVWDARNGAVLRTFQGHSDYVWSCAWSPDSQRLLSASYDNTLKVWDARTGEELLTLCHLPEHESAAFTKEKFTFASPGAWRHLCWRGFDPGRNYWRLYPAEAKGPLPGAPTS